MGMAHAAGGWTAETVRALPDDGMRYQVIDGELFVTPGPSWRHGDAVLGLVRRLDPDARVVERWRPADQRPEILDAQLEWQPDPTAPPLVLDLPAYFAEVWGE